MSVPLLSLLFPLDVAFGLTRKAREERPLTEKYKADNWSKGKSVQLCVNWDSLGGAAYRLILFKLTDGGRSLWCFNAFCNPRSMLHFLQVLAEEEPLSKVFAVSSPSRSLTKRSVALPFTVCSQCNRPGKGSWWWWWWRSRLLLCTSVYCWR